MRTFNSCVMLLLTLLVCGVSVRAQQKQDDDLIIAGRYMGKLWTHVEKHKVTFEDEQLMLWVRKNNLSAILLPKEQSGNRRKVRLCFKEKTVLDPERKVSAKDYDELKEYAVKKAYERGFKVVESWESGDLVTAGAEAAALRAELDSGPQDADKAADRRFVGELLAEVEPALQGLDAYVKEFKESVESKAFAGLNSFGKAYALKLGEPYVVGDQRLTSADLLKWVNPEQVNFQMFDGRAYRKVWIGSSLVLVAQMPGAGQSQADPTGLGLNPDWVAKVSPTGSKANIRLTPFYW